MKFLLTDLQLNTLIDKVQNADWPATVTATRVVYKLIVSITKWGTSVITFSIVPEPQNRNALYLLEVVKEDIAWLHKKYIPQIEKKISELVLAVGGKVLPDSA